MYTAFVSCDGITKYLYYILYYNLLSSPVRKKSRRSAARRLYDLAIRLVYSLKAHNIILLSCIPRITLQNFYTLARDYVF